MDTEKLYYDDPFLTRFSARVLSCVPAGDGFDVVLDRTAFYPEGGGQPCDTGVLGGAAVRAVHLRDGAVVHRTDAPLSPGGTVEGQIDWDRRFDLMQQHSGEHVVSGLLHAAFGCDNVGFHLGAETTTIDFDRPLTGEQLLDIEGRANRWLWEDREVRVLWPAAEELSALPYRSKKELDGPVRLVEFPGADLCACCGTHVRSGGQIGLVKFLSWQRFRDGVRIELVCGGRALDHLSRCQRENDRISALLSAKPAATSGAVERLLGEGQRLKEQAARWERAWVALRARELAGAGDVLLFEEGLSPDGVRRLADGVLDLCGGGCAVLSGDDGAGWHYAVGRHGGDVRPLVKAMNAALNGRGGGRPDFCQGSLRAPRREIEDFFAALPPEQWAGRR